MRICIGLAYDGRRFAGWQVQPGKRTVQGEVNRALSAIYAQPIHVTGAGRTDSGVHATGQRAHFDIDRPRVPVDRLVAAVRRHCPDDIYIYQAGETAPEFHACFDARSRSYRYRFVFGQVWPHERGIVTLWPYPEIPDLARLAATLEPLVGKHDFTSYTLVDQSAQTRERTLGPIGFELNQRNLDVIFTADGFLRRMIRMIAGQMLAAWKENDPARVMAEVLAASDNARSAAPAPPDGLYLENIRYQIE
jgi:tRNA pseudouridine38-40 synthase